jgi:hypothetical protein
MAQDVHVNSIQDWHGKISVLQEEKKTRFTSNLDLNLRKKVVKFYIWSIAFYRAETWTPRKVDHKYLESFEMWG